MAEIRWYGHNCFRIRAKEAIVLTDPVGPAKGFSPGKTTADIVTLSHNHPGHVNLDMVKPGYKLISGPGEYEMHGVFITGVRSKHAAEGGYNTIYSIVAEGMTFCHLGDLGRPLSAEQADKLSGIDVLFVSAGGDGLDPAQAAEVVAQLEPKLVVPMSYQAGGGDQSLVTLEPFVKQLGIPAPEPEDKLTVRSSDLSETTRLAVLRLSH